MSYENIIFEREENIAVIKFNRPKALNALNPDVLNEVEDALDKIKADSSIRVLIFTGEGEKAFIAGADIAHMVNFTPLQALEFARQGQELWFRLERLPMPIIACVNGFALGGGNELAMACDFIYSSENARFGQPEINLGVTPGFAGSQGLCKLVGKPMAKEICMTGVIISAQEAKEIGLVNKVFPHDKLWEETMKTAKILASKGKVSMRATKEGIDRGFDVDVRQGYYIAADIFAICMSSPDGKEGFSAFLEKRAPDFKGELT